MPTRPFSFLNQHGQRLSGKLEMPEGICRGWALFAHCFTCGKDNLAEVRIGRSLAQMGIGVLRFDFTGVGASQGSFEESSFTLNVRDLVLAAAAMQSAGMPIALLIGHSLGGAAVIAAAGELAHVQAIATIGAPFDVAHVLRQFSPAALAQIETAGSAVVKFGDRSIRVGRQLVDDLRRQEQGARIAALRRPILIMHAPLDQTVDIANATRIFLSAMHPKSFVSLDTADHLLSLRQDADYAASLIAAWAGRYLPDRIDAIQPEGDAEAEETGLGKFQVAVRSGGARWFADEPETVGGLGSGPTPYDLLSSALAACTTMTLRHYADSKGWAVDRIRTSVSHQKDKMQAPMDRFNRRVSIDGTLSDEQRSLLLDVAQRCPVHRTLENGVGFDVLQGDSGTADDLVSKAQS